MNPENPGDGPRRRVKARNWALVWAGWFIVLFVMSSLSHPGPKLDVAGFDKVEHATYFAAGGTCLALALALRGKTPAGALSTTSWPEVAAMVLMAGALVGWFDEWHQTFTPGRSGLDRHDWYADLVGSALGVPIAWLMLHWLARLARRT
jgi:VanZ family protein